MSDGLVKEEGKSQTTERVKGDERGGRIGREGRRRDR